MSQSSRGRTTSRTLASASVAAFALLGGACAPDVPAGRFACHSDEDCPSGWTCAPNADGNDRCYPSGSDFRAIRGRDAAAPDAGAKPDDTDAAEVTDSGGAAAMDAATGTTGNPTPVTPPTKPPAAGSGGARAGAPAAGSGGATAPPDAGEPEPPPVVANCEPETADADTGVFASPSGSMATDCGSLASPCATILLAMDRAQALSRAFIYLDSGTYAEPVTLRAGLTIRGGYKREMSSWTRLCDADRATRARIQSSEIVGVWAEYVGRTTLESLTIAARDKTPQGFSSYGVFARGPMTELLLRDVQVFAAEGGNGPKGSAGAMTPARAGTCTPGGDGTDAVAEGSPGTGAAAGKFDNTGYTPGNGAPGGSGLAGNNGVVGLASCKQCLDACDPTTCSGNVVGQSCGVPGLAGCGGTAAAGGGGGSGGGSSIGIYAWNAHVKIEGGLVQASDGGRGGVGGDPGVGGEGSDGTPGSNGDSCTVCSKGTTGPIIPPPPSPASTEAAAFEIAAADAPAIIAPVDGGVIVPISCISAKGNGIGTAGGRGGKGSRGGVGGGGSGGNSFGAYLGGTSQIEVSTSTEIRIGQAGRSQGNGGAGEAKQISRP